MMNKYAVDYSSLGNSLKEKPRTFKYEDVKHRLKVVAFDTVKFTDDDLSGLWQVNQTDDGEYIVASYEDAPITDKTASDWNVHQSGDNIHIFYKNEPLTKISLGSLNVPVEDRYLILNDLSIKLANSKELVYKLLQDLPETRKTEVLNTYPELRE